jgi:hypothetical protein
MSGRRRRYFKWLQMAEDYRDIAQDLTNGAIDIRHPERMPQSKKQQQGSGPDA